MISNNTINGLKGSLFAGDYLNEAVLVNNTVKTVTTVPTTLITVLSSTNVIIVGNKLPSGTTVDTPVKSTSTTNLINVSNSWN